MTDHDVAELSVSCLNPRTTLLRAKGAVDSATAQVIQRRVLQLFATQRNVVIDLSQVGYFGAAGLAALLVAHDAALTSGGRLHIVTGDRPAVLAPITRVGLDDLLHVHVTILDAVRNLPHEPAGARYRCGGDDPATEPVDIGPRPWPSFFT